MTTCKTCAHWSDKPPYGRVDFLHRTCECPKLQEDIYTDTPEDTLCYSYQEGGCFYAGPDFGCVHWIKKEVK